MWTKNHRRRNFFFRNPFDERSRQFACSLLLGCGCCCSSKFWLLLLLPLPPPVAHLSPWWSSRCEKNRKETFRHLAKPRLQPEFIFLALFSATFKTEPDFFFLLAKIINSVSSEVHLFHCKVLCHVSQADLFLDVWPLTLRSLPLLQLSYYTATKLQHYYTATATTTALLQHCNSTVLQPYNYPATLHCYNYNYTTTTLNTLQ